MKIEKAAQEGLIYLPYVSASHEPSLGTAEAPLFRAQIGWGKADRGLTLAMIAGTTGQARRTVCRVAMKLETPPRRGDDGVTLEPHKWRFRSIFRAWTASVSITAQKGSAVVFAGPTGAERHDLAVYIEETLGLQAHRISAHRARQLNRTVARLNQRDGVAGLRDGHRKVANVNLIGYRQGHRWHNNAAVSLLNDFDYLVQLLFAEQANTALLTHQRNRACDYTPALPTKLEQLSAIWHRMLQQRRLDVRGDDILVRSIAQHR